MIDWSWIRELQISVKLAWTLAIVGWVALGLSYREIWPFTSNDWLPPALAGFLALAGTARLSVEAGYAIRDAIARNREAAAKAARDRAAKRHRDEEAIRNLETLTEEELVHLMFVLREGRQRFDLPVEYSLCRKGIINRATDDVMLQVYDVADPIWSMRDALLERHNNVRTGRELPRRGRISI